MKEGEMEERQQEESARVSERAKQAEEVRVRWGWTEASVWTDRMLTALEKGVKGGKWFSLIDKVYAPATLRAAWDRVRANKGSAGVDRQTIEMFEKHLEENLKRLGEELSSGRYEPKAVERKWIPKGGKGKEKRPLGIPTVRDRVVQTALRSVLEPIYEREFAEHSYGFRPGRGCKDALGRVHRLLEEGYTWVVDADLKSYFDTIPKDALLERVREKVSDGRVLGLLRAYLDQPVMEGMKQWESERGTPQGAVISPLLSNLYLDPLDHLVVVQGYEMVRYADDFVILCRSKAEAHEALEVVQQWCARAGLTLHPEKTHIVDATRKGGFDFLGYHFERGLRWPRRKSLGKMKEAIRAETRRANGHSLKTIIANVNPILIGWFEYFKHSHYTTFSPIDQWVRMRLRSILRRRSGRRGRGRGRDHQRWKNAYFAQHGLFFLTTAHAAARQSSCR